jgi:hypothetical protein
MGSSPAPAPAPDPTALANAQANANAKTAKTQQQMNMVNQYTPQGSLVYSQTGKWKDGTPQYSATQTYSPEQQKLYDLGNQTQQNIGQIGVDQSARIGELLSTPFQANAARDNKIVEMQRGFLDPQWDRNEEKLRTQLINSGVRPGSEAYTRAMGDLSQNRQSAYDQMYLDAYRTAEGSALTERNQPINEISALLSGSQVSNPSYQSTPTAGVAPTDLIGANQLALQQQNLGTQMQHQQNMGLMSGLFGLGGTAMRGAFGGWG